VCWYRLLSSTSAFLAGAAARSPRACLLVGIVRAGRRSEAFDALVLQPKKGRRFCCSRRALFTLVGRIGEDDRLALAAAPLEFLDVGAARAYHAPTPMSVGVDPPMASTIRPAVGKSGPTAQGSSSARPGPGPGCRSAAICRRPAPRSGCAAGCWWPAPAMQEEP